MSRSGSTDPLARTGEDYLLEKIRYYRSIARDFPRHISDHMMEVVERSNEHLVDAKEAADLEVQRTYRYECCNHLLALGGQIEIYSAVEKSQKDRRWKLLNIVVSDVSRYFELNARPIVFLGGTYEVTGSNIYEKEYGVPKPSPFYQIGTDISDPFALCSLVAHEAGHCKISEIGGIEVGEDIRRKIDVAELEQCLCDALAIQMYGPAFVLPFVIYNENQIGVDRWINFRSRLMLDMLEDFELQNVTEAIHRFIGENRYNQIKKARFVQPQVIINFARKHIRTNDDLTDRNLIDWANGIYKIPVGRTDILFNAAWFKFLFDPKMSLNEISEIVVKILEGWTNTANSLG